MGNVLETVGSSLNALGVRRIHEFITGDDYTNVSEPCRKIRDIFTGGTAVVIVLLCFLTKKLF